MTNFADIFTKPTEDELYQVLLNYMKSVGMPIERIGSTSGINLLMRAQIKSVDFLFYIIQQLGLNLTNIRNASGLFLDLLGEGFYDLQRYKPRPASGNIYMDITSIGITSLTLTNPVTGVKYKAAHDGTIVSNISLFFVADTLGEVSTSDISQLVPSAATYRINTASNSTTGIGWIQFLGRDLENDEAYRQRCLDVIAQKNLGSTKDNFYAKMRTITGGIASRFYIKKTSYTNTSILYVAASSGQIDSNNLQIIADAANLYTQADSVISTVYAINFTLQISGSIYFKTNSTSTQKERVRSELAKWINSLPITQIDNTKTQLHIYDVYNRLINVIDTENIIVYPSLTFQIPGGEMQQSIDISAPLPMIDGGIYVADLSKVSLSNVAA